MVTVLVVDDEPDGQRLLSIMLEKEGFQVVTASGGSDAMSKALANPPDVAVLDVMMPDMDGYQLCRRFRESPRLSRVPILILTARAQPVDRAASMRAGADAYISKPFQRAELVRTVQNLVAAQSGASSNRARLISCVSLRGGVGVSVLAVNLAVVTTLKHRRNVLLADLKFSSGQDALFLNLKPQDAWTPLVDAARSVEWNHVEGNLVKHPCGLTLLSAPPSPFAIDALPPAVIPSVISTTRDHFDRVFVDMPSMLLAPMLDVLLASDLVLLVLAPEVAALQSVCGLTSVLKTAAVPPERIAYVINRPGPIDSLSPGTIERVMGGPPLVALPHEPEPLTEATVKGNPVLLERPTAAWSRAAADLATAIESRWK